MLLNFCETTWHHIQKIVLFTATPMITSDETKFLLKDTVDMSDGIACVWKECTISFFGDIWRKIKICHIWANTVFKKGNQDWYWIFRILYNTTWIIVLYCSILLHCVFITISHATRSKSFKIQNLKFLKRSIVSNCMSLFNTHMKTYNLKQLRVKNFKFWILKY
jgi:hypothetical protein